MVGNETQRVLAETEREQGRKALRNNVAAAVALAGAVRTTLGPSGMDKMLVDEAGMSLVTNDGVTVLETAKVEHPTARMLISTSSAQDAEAKDGTTTTVVLTAELLVNALELVDRGVHPAVVATGFRAAAAEVPTALAEIAHEVKGREDRIAATLTSLSGKGDAGMRSILSELAVDAAAAVESDEQVRVIHRRSGIVTDSNLVQGLVLAKQKVHREMPERSEGGKVLILDGGIERRSPAIEASLRITQPGAIQAFHTREREELARKVQVLADAGVALLIVRDGIEDDAHVMLADAGIIAYRRVEREDLEHIARATGATPLHDVDNVRSEDLGAFTELREEKWEGREHMALIGSEEAGVTLVLHGSTESRLAECERAFIDALGVACGLEEEPALLPGAGATQIALARRLRRFAETIPGREQMAVDAFAAALEVIPRILAQNAGLDPIDELLRVTAAQSSDGDDWLGLNILTGEITDMGDAGVTEPVRITRQAISGATDAAIAVLRIDDTLWARKDAEEPDWQTSED